MTERANDLVTPPPEEVQIIPCPVCGVVREQRIRRLDAELLAILDRDGEIRETHLQAAADELGASLPVLCVILHRLRREGVLSWGWLRLGWGFRRAEGVV